MLAHPNQIPTNFNLYQNKLIRIISPFSGEQFKIELGGKEEEFRDLLATLLNIDSSYIKGLKDSYGNYYTLSSALNNLFIFSNENNLFSLVLNISNKSNNKYKHYNDSFDRNMLYNVNNNYHNRTEFNEIYIDNSNKKLMKSKSNYRYTTLIKELIPAINRNFRDDDENENESFYNEKWSFSRHPKFAKILENLKKKFSKEQYKILKELLKMENITIINYFKLYEKSKDKKELIKNLNSLYKKYHKKIKKDFSSSDEDSSINKSKRTKKSKHTKKRSEKSETSSESEESSKHIKKSNHRHHKKKERSSSSSPESKSSKSSSKSKSKNKDSSQSKESDDKESNTKSSEESEEEEENSEENKNNFPIKCSSLEDLIDNIKELFNNNLVVNCLFTNDIDFLKKTEIQKTKLLKEEFNINNFTITKSVYDAIKVYYEDIMKKIIEKNMTEDEKTLLHKLIKKKNKSIKLRFRALFRHNNYELLTSDLKECMKDHIKRKKGSEHKINLKKNNESISINSNSYSSNDNDNNENGEENYGDDNSSKSIRKNERMAKNNKKKNEQKSQKSQKSKEEESIGQFKLMEMNDDGSKEESNSKKSENFSKSRKSSSKIANEKEDENFENNFIPLIKKMKEDGSINITDNEVNILINEFNKKNKMLLAFIEEYQGNKDQEEFNDSIDTFIKDLYNKKVYTEGQPVNIVENNNENMDHNANNKKNVTEEEQPYEKEVIAGLKGLKFGKKGNKKIINILLKNNVFTKEQMRNIEEDLDQNNNFIVGAFELIYITMNAKDLVENINIRLQLSQSEKENQIKNNLDIIMKSFSEEEQNKVRELYEAKDANLMNILESEMNDIKKAKASILNFLEKN